MTLLLTEVGAHGVVMVAESADRCDERAPYSHKDAHHLAYGAKKIVPIPRLHCAIGIWGMGMVEAKEFTCSPAVWVEDYIEHHGELNSLQAVAEAVRAELKEILKEPDRPFGFQIAGGPPGQPREFWEATNIAPRGGEIGWQYMDIISLAPGQMLRSEGGSIRLARGLNYGTGVLNGLDQVMSSLIEFGAELSGINADILRRAEYLSACVRFISDVEKASGHATLSVGGDTSFATIDLDGVIHFKPPYENVARVN